MTPAHKQTNPDKAPGQVVNPVLLPCRSPYCECSAGKCTHPGFYDARGTKPVHTLGDYLKLKETLSGIPSATTKEFNFGWNSALAEIAKFVDGIYPTDYFDEFDNGFGGALDAVEDKIGSLKK